MKIKKSHLKELIRQSIRSIVSEADDDKYIHIGYGRYKKKGQEDKEGAPTFKKTDVGKFVKTTPADDDVGGPAHPNVPKKEPAKPKTTKIKADPFADKGDEFDVGGPAHANVPKGAKTSKAAKKDWGKHAMDASKKANKKMEIDTLNKRAEQGRGDLIDTERYGMVTWENGDVDEDSFIAINQEGESIELDYDEIVRFHNDDENESKLKSIQGGGDDKSKKEPSHADIIDYAEENFTSGDAFDDDGNPTPETYQDAKDELMAKMKESIKESKFRKRCTIKEVRMWMKKLEENRYKKVYNSDCRRVAWMINHIGENVVNMPKSMRKKWTKAQYGRERYLTKEFLKSKKLHQMNEQKLRKLIRNIIKEVRLNEVKFAELYLKNDWKTKKIVSKIIKKMRLKIDKDYDVKALSARGGEQKFMILPKHRNDFLELLIKNNIKVRG